ATNTGANDEIEEVKDRDAEALLLYSGKQVNKRNSTHSTAVKRENSVPGSRRQQTRGECLIICAKRTFDGGDMVDIVTFLGNIYNTRLAKRVAARKENRWRDDETSQAR